MGIQTGQTRIVLASASPRRAQLLAQLGISHEVDPANVDERRRAGEAPVAYVERMAREKAAAVAGRAPQALVLGADTAVVAGDEVLGKPADANEARQMLARLSGRSHRVLTGVAVDGTARAVSSVETQVTFRTLSEAEIAWYVGTGEPLDKAGAYAIQGAGGAFVVRVEGSVSNVIGLPLAETLALLAGAGFRWPPEAP